MMDAVEARQALGRQVWSAAFAAHYGPPTIESMLMGPTEGAVEYGYTLAEVDEYNAEQRARDVPAERERGLREWEAMHWLFERAGHQLGTPEQVLADQPFGGG